VLLATSRNGHGRHATALTASMISASVAAHACATFRARHAPETARYALSSAFSNDDPERRGWPSLHLYLAVIEVRCARLVLCALKRLAQFPVDSLNASRVGTGCDGLGTAAITCELR
jgi:hypothetical protein